MSTKANIFSAIDGIKGAFLVDFHAPVSSLGKNLTKDQLEIYNKFVEILNLHIYVGGVEVVADEDELISQFDLIMPASGIPTQLMDSIFKYLRILLLSNNSVQVEHATILIGHVFLNYNDNVVNLYINNNRRFMKTLSIVARRQLGLNTEASIRAANRILAMIRLWAETYKLLKKPNSYIWDTYVKLTRKYLINLPDPDPAILKKTCIKVGRKTNMDSSSDIMKELDAETARHFEDYKVFEWDLKETPESPLTIDESQIEYSEAKDYVLVETPKETSEVMTSPKYTIVEEEVSGKSRGILEMLGLSFPSSEPVLESSLGESANQELCRRPLSIKVESETPSTKQTLSGRFPFGLGSYTSPLEKPINGQNSQVLNQRSGKILDVDFSNVSLVRAKWRDIDAKEANKSFSSGSSLKRSNSTVHPE